MPRNRLPFTPIDEYHKDRLLAFVLKPEDLEACWPWNGALKDTGYGRIRVNYVEYIASRLSYAVHYKCDPGEFDVCHSCDTPACTNPKHLFLGTHIQNIQDAVSKGRWKHKGQGISRNKGLSNGQCRLTDEEISRVRELRQQGRLQKHIAAEFGISRCYVSQLMTGARRSV